MEPIGRHSYMSLVRSWLNVTPPGSEAAMRDVAEAYRTIPLHPSQWPAMVVRAPHDTYYIDKCLSFRAAPSASTYGHVTDAAAEIFRSNRIGPLDKWVDDHVFFHVRRNQ